jgi:hypothetical protein
VANNRTALLVSLLNLEAWKMRKASRQDILAKQQLCLLMAMIVCEKREEDDTTTGIATSDKEFFEDSLKPLLKFIIFINTYYPFSCPSQTTIELWSNLIANRQVKIQTEGSGAMGITSKEIYLDSARKNVDNQCKEYEVFINRICENIQNNQPELKGQ